MSWSDLARHQHGVISRGQLRLDGQYDQAITRLVDRNQLWRLHEAVFLVRAYRTTLQRFGGSEPVDTGRMAVQRRISATFKDLPGGQVLGPTFDYTHRLIDFDGAEAASGLVFRLNCW